MRCRALHTHSCATVKREGSRAAQPTRSAGKSGCNADYPFDYFWAYERRGPGYQVEADTWVPGSGCECDMDLMDDALFFDESGRTDREFFLYDADSSRARNAKRIVTVDDPTSDVIPELKTGYDRDGQTYQFIDEHADGRLGVYGLYTETGDKARPETLRSAAALGQTCPCSRWAAALGAGGPRGGDPG